MQELHGVHPGPTVRETTLLYESQMPKLMCKHPPPVTWITQDKLYRDTNECSL